jgi:hypothetical protein
MAEIHVYGKLRRCAQDVHGYRNGVIRPEIMPDDTVKSLLTRLGISGDEIYTIFFNHKLLAARSKMAMWIGHQQVGPAPNDWNLDIPVQSGDRIGLFGRDMSALVV